MKPKLCIPESSSVLHLLAGNLNCAAYDMVSIHFLSANPVVKSTPFPYRKYQSFTRWRQNTTVKVQSQVWADKMHRWYCAYLKFWIPVTWMFCLVSVWFYAFKFTDVCLFVCLVTGHSVRRHTCVLMGSDSNKVLTFFPLIFIFFLFLNELDLNWSLTTLFYTTHTTCIL